MQSGSRDTRRQSTSLAAAVATFVLVLAGCGGGGGSTGTTRPSTTAAGTTETGPGGSTGATGPVLTPAPRRRTCTAGPDFACFRLRVPLDRDGRVQVPDTADRGATGPSDRRSTAKVTLQVAVQRGRPSRGYLLYLTGGPGQPGLPFAARVRQRLGPVLAGNRLVLVDQRGTGVSALRCPGLQRSVGASDVAVAARGTVEECGRRIGSKRAAFSTADTVADLEDLRVALGAEKLTLAGVSYGSFVAERYALAHPGHVRGLVLDSVVPQDGADVLQRANLAALPLALRRACAAARCPRDPAGDLLTAVRRGLDGVSLLDVAEALSIGEQRLPVLARALHEAAAGRSDAFERLAARVQAVVSAYPVSQLSAGLHDATLCAESRTPWPDATALPADREQALAQALERLRPAALGGLPPAVAVRNGLADACRRWPPQPVAPPALPAGAKLPDVPTLLLSGALDLSTPPAEARRQLARSPGGRLLSFPASGHSVLSNDATGCAVGAVGDLLAGRALPRRCDAAVRRR